MKKLSDLVLIGNSLRKLAGLVVKLITKLIFQLAGLVVKLVVDY